MDTTAPTDADVIALDRETFDWFAATPHSHPLHGPVQGPSLVAGNEAPCPHCPLMNCAADAECAGMSVDVGLAKSDTWETPVPGWGSLSGTTGPDQLGLHRIQIPPPKIT